MLAAGEVAELLGLEEAGAMNLLLEGLRCPYVPARRGAARTLGPFGPQAYAAAPELLAASRDKDALLRKEAIRALAQVAPLDESTSGGMAEALQDPDPRVQEQAARSIKTLADFRSNPQRP